MKVSSILKGQPDDLGRINIVIRIADGKKRSFRKTGLKVRKDEFAKGLVKATHPLHRAYNLKIKQELLNVEKAGSFDDETTAVLFSDYHTELLRRWDKSKRPETLRQYQSELNKFKRFNPVATLSDFTPALLQKYKEYCFAQGNTENTVWKSFKAIRTIILRAHREGLIKTNPFPLFEMPKYRDPQKVWLTEDEINRIEKLRETELPKEIYFTATWFLIGCYTGLRFGDMMQFNKREHIRQGRLILYTSKTGEVVSMPFTDRLKALFSSIDYQSIYFTNTHYNRLLKQVQGMAEIKRTLTGHVSRHTSAVRWANHGVSQEVVGKLLGHSNLKTTSIYFKISGLRIDKELPE